MGGAHRERAIDWSGVSPIVFLWVRCQRLYDRGMEPEDIARQLETTMDVVITALTRPRETNYRRLPRWRETKNQVRNRGKTGRKRRPKA